jgi:hypothetical protein
MHACAADCREIISVQGDAMKAMFLGLVLAVATLTGSFAADDRNVTVVNGTGYGIKFLGFNSPGDNDWSDNEISGVMGDGDSKYVKFGNADKGCKWNIRISWAEAGYPDVMWRNVDLCSIDKITLKYNRDTDTTSFVSE